MILEVVALDSAIFQYLKKRTFLPSRLEKNVFLLRMDKINKMTGPCNRV